MAILLLLLIGLGAYAFDSSSSGSNDLSTDDILDAGDDGDDTLIGTASNDLIVGNGGDDSLAGQQGNDFLVGGTGDDILRGNAGDDYIVANSLVDGEKLEDAIDVLVSRNYSSEQDVNIAVEAEVSNAFSYDNVSPDGDDTIYAGPGEDILVASGSDLLYGGDGNDVFGFVDQHRHGGVSIIGDYQPDEAIIFEYTDGSRGELYHIVEGDDAHIYFDDTHVVTVRGGAQTVTPSSYYARFVA